MHRKLAVVCIVGVVLVSGATRVSADGPGALTDLELDGVTVARWVPDRLRQLRIVVGATDDPETISDELIAEQRDTAVSRQPVAAGSAQPSAAVARQSAPAVNDTRPAQRTGSDSAWASRPTGGWRTPQRTWSRPRPAIEGAAPLRSVAPRMMRTAANRGSAVRP